MFSIQDKTQYNLTTRKDNIAVKFYLLKIATFVKQDEQNEAKSPLLKMMIQTLIQIGMIFRDQVCLAQSKSYNQCK